MNVENAFGMLSSRFQIFKKPMCFMPSKVDLFVMTACILHNYLIDEKKDINSDINSETHEMNNLESCNVNASSRSARLIRDEIAEYCNNEGAVSWQNQCIFK